MTKYPHFMIDVETLGTKPDAAVVQIGVVGFNPDTGEVSEPRTINTTTHPKSSMDESTLRWWLCQSDAARQSVFTGDAETPEAALGLLNWFIADNSAEVYRVWAKPSTFDLVILESLYNNCKMKAPWPHWSTRCLRTLIDTAKLAKEDEAIPSCAHDAGSDAKAQAETAIKCFKKLDNGNARG